MANWKRPLDVVLTKTAASGTNDLLSDPVPPGEMMFVQHIVVENKTSACTGVRVMKRVAQRIQDVVEQLAVNSATLYWHSDPFFVRSGERLMVRFSGCTAGDNLVVSYLGYYAREGS